MLETYQPPKKLLELSNLKDNWFGAAKIILQNTINKTILLDKTAYDNKLFDTEFFPGLDGEILLAIFQGTYCMEFIIEENKAIFYTLDRDNIEIDCKDNLSLEEAKQLIVAFKNYLSK